MDNKVWGLEGSPEWRRWSQALRRQRDPPRKENRLKREKAGGRQPFPLIREDTKAHRGNSDFPRGFKVLGRGGGRERRKTQSQSTTAGVHTTKDDYFFVDYGKNLQGKCMKQEH